jgi:hypothetical protein
MSLDELAQLPHQSGSITLYFLPDVLVIGLSAQSTAAARMVVDSGRCHVHPPDLADEALGVAVIDAMLAAGHLVRDVTFAQASQARPHHLAEAAGLGSDLDAFGKRARAVMAGRSPRGDIVVSATRNEHTEDLALTALPKPLRLQAPSAVELGQAVHTQLAASC